ncbi:MAG: response regulator transcription factor [Desulfobacterales bacterium]|nr:response regulator transcription factor [Desulfobacterales bacterium]
MKVLLVDDEIEFVSTLAERLSFRGIDVDWISEPEEAIAKARQGCYDVAVLDVKMPRIDGIALKRQLQQTCPKMKFIFITGHGSRDAYMAGSAEAGSDCYLHKPLSLADLLAKISVIAAAREE